MKEYPRENNKGAKPREKKFVYTRLGGEFSTNNVIAHKVEYTIKVIDKNNICYLLSVSVFSTRPPMLQIKQDKKKKKKTQGKSLVN